MAGVIREAVGKVERWLGMDEGGSGRRRRRRRGIGTERSNSGNSRGGNGLARPEDEGERSGTVVVARGEERDDGVQMAPQGLPGNFHSPPPKQTLLSPSMAAR